MLINVAAQNRKETRDWYALLGFTLQDFGSERSVASDNQFSVVLDHSNTARIGFIILQSNAQDLSIKRINDRRFTISPMGMFVELVDELPVISRPDISAKLGKFYGYGIECFDLELSLAFWQKLGFASANIPDDTTAYLPLKKAGSPDLTLYKMGSCPHKFVNPSLTFFNGKDGNAAVLRDLRSLGLSFSEEITVFNDSGIVDNAIISDPTGLHSFLFNDG